MRSVKSRVQGFLVLMLIVTSAAADVRLDGRVLVDGKGPFLGLGATYMCALHDVKFDRERLLRELTFLEQHGFNFVRVLSMVGHHSFWDGKEIAPVPFVNRDGKTVAAWPDYDDRLAELIDTVYSAGLRTELTVFADAQLMPDVSVRMAHLDRVLQIVNERADKVLMLEVANEAWQNGFPDEAGERELRAMGAYLKARTSILVALSSPSDTSLAGLHRLYDGSKADVATVHFSRDTRTDEGPWLPVRDCWRVGYALGVPVSSNEPIGPGASVASDDEPSRLVGAAMFAYIAGLPMYVLHATAGIRGDRSYRETPGAASFAALHKLLPQDLPNWSRCDASADSFPVKVLTQRTVEGRLLNAQGCRYFPGALKGRQFVAALVGVPDDGIEATFMRPAQLTACDALTGQQLRKCDGRAGDTFPIEMGHSLIILQGEIQSMP